MATTQPQPESWDEEATEALVQAMMHELIQLQVWGRFGILYQWKRHRWQPVAPRQGRNWNPRPATRKRHRRIE